MKNRRFEFFFLGVLLAFGISFMILKRSARERGHEIPDGAEIRFRSQLSGLYGASNRKLISQHTLYQYAIVYQSKSSSMRADFEKLVADSGSKFAISHSSPRNKTTATLFLSEEKNLRWKPIDERGMNEVPPETWPFALQVWLYSPEEGLLKNVLAVQTLLYKFAKTTGGFIADMDARTVFEAEAWNENRLDTWDEYPYLPSHVTMTYLKRGKWYRARSMGMRKFGLPEVTVAAFSASYLTELVALMKLTCQTLLERPILATDGRYRLNISGLAATRLKGQLEKIASQTAPGEIEIELALVKAIEAKSNRNLEIRCLHLPGLTLMQKQEYLVVQIFGESDREGVCDQ